MPDKLDSKLLAPCGINCISCERYQNPCAGCLIGDDGKTKASLKCKIKSCFDKQGQKMNCGKIINGNGTMLFHDLEKETNTIQKINFENGIIKNYR